MKDLFLTSLLMSLGMLGYIGYKVLLVDAEAGAYATSAIAAAIWATSSFVALMKFD